jgi:hypothetical protein
MTTPRWQPRYAARVARVTVGGGHGGEGTIMFASGDAYPESLPDGVDSDELAAHAERQGVQLQPASHFHAGPPWRSRG